MGNLPFQRRMLLIPVPGSHQKNRLSHNRLRVIPFFNIIQRICPDNKIKLIFWIFFTKQRQRLCRIGVSRTPKFKIRKHQAILSFQRQPDHFQTNFCVRYFVVLLVRGLSGRHKPDLIQRIFLFCLPAQLQVAIGPSIGKGCFEVDEPVAVEFQKLPQWEKFVSGPEREKYHVDLWECNRQFLLSAGVLPEHITVGQVCTMCESDLVFSHRKTRGQRGSNCAMLALKP